jgi:WD40 repeat protein
VGGSNGGYEHTTLRIFDTVTGEQIDDYTPPRASEVKGLLYSRNGKYLIVAWDGVVEIWDADRKRLLQTIAQDTVAMTLSADDRYLAMAEANRVITVRELK